ncbi:MAG: ATPase [Actinomycetia bacterium]|nr:ATPase [Actinomycetes bacterium]
MLLGPFEVIGPAGPVLFRGAKERLVLALLAARPNEVVPASSLIDGLWGETPPATAAKTLQAHVAHLRRAMEAAQLADAVVTRDPGYLLRVEPDRIDAVRFERLANAGHDALVAGDPGQASHELSGALALWRGDALADCRGAEPLQAEAVRLEELRMNALEDRIAADLALGSHAALVAEVESLLAAHPLREALWHALVLALYRSGRQGDALAAYQRARKTLVEALGVEPGPELRRLEIAMLEGDPALDPVPPVVRRRAEERPSGSRLFAAAATGPRFVGREHELESMVGGWDRARRGRHETVLVAGEPGIGKTRLAAELAVAAQADGAYVLHGRCDEGLGVPYQPFVEALRDHVEASDDATLAATLGGYANELVRLAPELAERDLALQPPLQSDPATEQFRLFDAVCAWLAAVSRDVPVVLVVDDLHWAAPPTILLLRHLILSDRSMRLLLIATYRDSELSDAPVLGEMLADLRRVPRVDRVALRGLDERAVVAFVRAAAGRDLDAAGADFARAVFEQTAGNPFFVNEIVRNLAETKGALDELQPTGTAIPVAAREVVMRRVGRLPAVARQALTVAALVGAEFDVAVLQHALVDVGTGALLEALEDAARAHLVEELAPNRFVFAHAIVRGALSDTVSASRRLWLHGQIGAAIEAVHQAHLQEHFPELVYHYAEAAPAKAVPYAIDAATAALDSLAFEDAINVARRGLAAAEHARLNGTPVPAPQACDLCLLLGRAELRAGQPMGRTTLLRAYDIARTIGDTQRQAHAALAVNRGYFARIGQTDEELVASLEDAIAAQPPGDTAELAELLATLASELVWAPDGDRRFELSASAIDIARRVGDHRTLATVLLRAMMTIPAPDTLDARLATRGELVEIAAELQDPAITFDAAFAHSSTAWESGDIDATNEMEEIATALAKELRQPRLVWQASFMRTSRLIVEGRLDEAATCASETLELGTRAGQGEEAFIYYTEQVLEIRRWQDRLSELLDVFGGLAGRDDIDFGYSLTRYLYDAGEHAAAADAYAAVMSRLELPPRRDMLALPTLYNLSYLAARLNDATGAQVLYDVLLPSATRYTNTTVAKPVGHHALGMLAATLGDTRAAIRHFERAIDAHERVRAPLLLAETQLETARLVVGTGGGARRAAPLIDAVRTTAASSGALALLRACDDIDVP